MKRARRRKASPPQLSLAARGGGRGGYRAGAGRPRKKPGQHVGHWPRAKLASRYPVHVTLRVRPGLESLRRGRNFRVIRGCFEAGKERFGFRLIHFSVQSNHIHLLCEAEDERAVARGMKGLAVRIARRLNKALGRRGSLFAQRYHARILRTPTETRNALIYVLGNAARHLGGRFLVDMCSSGPFFTGWRYRPREPWLQPTGVPPVVPAATWLLREGWMRWGPLSLAKPPG